MALFAYASNVRLVIKSVVYYRPTVKLLHIQNVINTQIFF